MARHKRVQIIRVPNVRLTENDIMQDADGGRIVLGADSRDLGVDIVEGEEKLAQATLVFNYRQDDPMKKYPLSRRERAERRFEIVVNEIVEVTDDDKDGE